MLYWQSCCLLLLVCRQFIYTCAYYNSQHFGLFCPTYKEYKCILWSGIFLIYCQNVFAYNAVVSRNLQVWIPYSMTFHAVNGRYFVALSSWNFILNPNVYSSFFLQPCKLLSSSNASKALQSSIWCSSKCRRLKVAIYCIVYGVNGLTGEAYILALHNVCSECVHKNYVSFGLCITTCSLTSGDLGFLPVVAIGNPTSELITDFCHLVSSPFSTLRHLLI